jgi:phosphinothricin acetyltransferase
MPTPNLRLATAGDLLAINKIYNYYVLRSTCTYQLDPETTDARRAWFEHHSPDKYAVPVAEVEGRPRVLPCRKQWDFSRSGD